MIVFALTLAAEAASLGLFIAAVCLWALVLGGMI
jgi:hypothetical protein